MEQKLLKKIIYFHCLLLQQKKGQSDHIKDKTSLPLYFQVLGCTKFNF